MPATGTAAPPTLLALDEVANIAPIPDLPAMVSEGAGQGLLVLACLQDLSQARGRWGAAADGFLSLFGTTVVLRGIADTATLRDISALAGDREVAATTVSRSVDRWGRIRPSTSVGSARQARLPVDAVARGAPGRALVLGPHKEVREVALTPAARALALARARAGGARARPRAETRGLEPLSQRPEAELDRDGPRGARAGPGRRRAAASVRRWSARRVAGSDARLGRRGIARAAPASGSSPQRSR